MSGRRAPYRISIEIDNEVNLQQGPRGDIVEVYDYDASNDQFYEEVNLNESRMLMEGGVSPSESDPRFHQQMVYAVAMKVIESARRALGRPVTFYGGSTKPRLRLFPHAFYGANAFYDSKLNAVLFGYFRADSDSPGPNLPSQTIFTCLSHDIIAHEVTHAIVHRLRRYFLEPTNIDVLAFHEAFSDIVSIFQRFSYRDLLAEHIQSSQGRLHEAKMLIDLAQQFGFATGMGKALRSALGVEPDASLLKRTFEPHKRGAILVSAVFSGYFKAYQNRIADLLRIATGGSGQLPSGRLHPDLVNRLATEASQLADRVLRMCFRAFDYLPPVDVTFGDFLRALVTSDFELNPEDRDELRYCLIESFRERGIYPASVPSLAEESLIWANAINGDPPPMPPDLLSDARELLAFSTTAMDRSPSARRSAERMQTTSTGRQALDSYQQAVIESAEEEAQNFNKKVFGSLTNYARDNALFFGLDPGNRIAVTGFHASQRTGTDQRPAIELVAQFVQTDEGPQNELGGIPFRGGATVIFGADGAVRYVISKPMSSAGLPDALKAMCMERLQKAKDYVQLADLNDPRMVFADAGYIANRTAMRANFRAMHEGHM